MGKTYNASKTVSRFLHSTDFIRGIMGPFGSGKSVGCVIDRNINASQQKPNKDNVRRTKYAVVRNTYKELEDSTIETFMEWMGEAGEYKSQAKEFHMEYRQPDGTIVESKFLFRALNRPEDVSKLLSTEYTGAWLNEFREIPIDILFSLIGRINRFPPKADVPDEIWKNGKLIEEGAYLPETLKAYEDDGYDVVHGGATTGNIVLDTNPFMEDGEWDNFFKQDPDSEEMREFAEMYESLGLEVPTVQLFEQPGGLDEDAENLENLTGGRKYYLDLLVTAKRRGETEDWINVHVHGKRGTSFSGKSVYGDDFNPDFHIAKEILKPIPGMAIGVGRDYGLDPAAVFFQIDTRGRWRVLSELVAFGQTEEQFLDSFTSYSITRFPGHAFFFVADPAGNQRAQSTGVSCHDVDIAAGYTVIPGPQDLDTRLGAVRYLLGGIIGGQAMLQINPECKWLLNGMRGGYKYRKLNVVGEERYSLEPEKNQYSHSQDAFQYPAAHFTSSLRKGGGTPSWPRVKPRQHMKPHIATAPNMHQRDRGVRRK